MNRMDPKIKKKWLKALRTNKIGRKPIKKGRQYLAPKGLESPERCCLGVLTEIAVNQGVEISLPFWKTWGATTALSPEVSAWAGLEVDPGVPYAGDVIALATLNDGQCVSDFEDNVAWVRKPLTFKKIADLIEKHL